MLPEIARPIISKRPSGGFTLVEMIVAVSILALVAVLGWRGLDGIVRARVVLTNELEQTRSMQLTFAQMQSDSAHLAPATLIGARIALAVSSNGLTMIRMVFLDQQPTQMEVISYRLQNCVLKRQESMPTRDLAALDAAWQAAVNEIDVSTADSHPMAVQTDIASMRIRVWDQVFQNWKLVDPVTSSATPHAAAPVNWTGLEIALQLRAQDGLVVKTFFLGAA